MTFTAVGENKNIQDQIVLMSQKLDVLRNLQQLHTLYTNKHTLDVAVTLISLKMAQKCTYIIFLQNIDISLNV